MEALLLIVGELVAAILAPFVALVVELIGAAAAALFSFVPGWSETLRKALRVMLWLLGALAGLVLSAVLVVNLFFFDDAVRYVFDRVEGRTAIEARCESIDGSLFFGEVDLGNCTFRRPADASTTFDLSLGRIALDLEMMSLFGTASLETATVDGLEGWVRRAAKSSEADSDDREVRPRRRFEVQDLRVSEIRVELAGTNADGNAYQLPVTIESLAIQPLRSRLALFDVLFRSTGKGSIDGAPFSLATREVGEGRQTEWRAERVPIASLGAMTGGALAWFESGYVDVNVDDEWARGETTTIDMDWTLEFSDITVAPPPGTSIAKRFVTAPLTGYVNRFGGEFPLEFSLVLNENDFEYTSSLAAAGLWSAVGGAVNNALSLVGVELDTPESTGERLKEGAKSVLDRVRRKDTDVSTDDD